jgi:hypothetical protein
MDGTDIGVVKGGGRLGFLQEPFFRLQITSQLRRQKLEGDSSLKLCVLGLVHDAHPAFAQFRDNLIAAGEAGKNGRVNWARLEPGRIIYSEEF